MKKIIFAFLLIKLFIMTITGITGEFYGEKYDLVNSQTLLLPTKVCKVSVPLENRILEFDFVEDTADEKQEKSDTLVSTFTSTSEKITWRFDKWESLSGVGMQYPGPSSSTPDRLELGYIVVMTTTTFEKMLCRKVEITIWEKKS